jgi:hypothetical protein
MIKAKEHCCEEAAMGMGDAYFPCNQPATKIIRPRQNGSEPDLRMCDMCADHSVRNRGMLLVGPYTAPPRGRYAFWQDSLAGLKPPIINEQPECGFWRMKRGGRWIPVAVWPLPGANQPLGFKFGAEVVGQNMGIEQWPWYAANPITEPEYRKVADRGEDWSDADPTVAAILSGNGDGATIRGAAVSRETYATLTGPDATKPVGDATEEFAEQINAALGGVPTYAKIASDEASVRATSLRNMLNDLARDADKAREAEKAPHLKAEREIDARWQPIIKQAREGARKIKEANDGWEDDKRAAARQAADRAAQVARQEAAARAKAEAEGRPAPAPAAPPPPSNLPPPATQIRPTHGKAAHVGTKMVVTAVDWDRMIAALKPRPEWPTLEAFLHEMAQKLANRGIILDGVTAEERANTR